MAVTTILTDAIEYFNPMHDLCHVLARRLAVELSAARSQQILLMDFVNERQDLKPASPLEHIVLDGVGLANKRKAVLSYRALTADIVRRDQIESILRNERLYPVDPEEPLPASPPELPYYEDVGRDRVAGGHYGTVITYSEHVRPLSEAILGKTLQQ